MIQLINKQMKSKINLGCGNDISNPDIYINHDIRKHRPEIDVEFDLNYHSWLTAGRLLEITNIGRNLFDEIRALDVIEHLDDPINFMNNCWDLLKPDGILHIKACGWQNPNFWVDITHKKGYDIKSFDYFVPTTSIGIEYGYYTDKRWIYCEGYPKYDKHKNIIVKLSPLK